MPSSIVFVCHESIHIHTQWFNDYGMVAGPFFYIRNIETSVECMLEPYAESQGERLS